MENGQKQIFDNQFTYNDGLTKREYFAGLAMQGMLSAGKGGNSEDWVRLADELLKQLEK